MRKFLHSKPSYTKFTLATRKFKRMKAFARFKNEIWCMDLVYVDKLAKDKNGVKYLLVRQDLFDGTVDAKTMKTKDSKQTVRAFLTMTHLDGQWEVAISEIPFPSMYQNDTEGKFMFFDKKLSKSSEFNFLEHGLYPSITDIVEAMNIIIQGRHIHSKNCFKVKVSRRTQKVEIYFANEGSALAFFSTDLGHIFGSKVVNKLGVMLRGTGPHKPEFA